MSLTRALSFLSIFLRLPMRMKSSWSLPSIVSSLRVAVVAARCSNVSVSSLVIAAVVAACFCSSISATSFAASFSLVTCCCSSISDSSCAAACCSPFTLISSSSYLCSTSWSFVDKLETSRGSNEAKYLVYLVSLWDFVSAFFLSDPPFFQYVRRGNVRSPICGRFPSESCRLPPRQCSILFFLSVTTQSRCFSFPSGDMQVHCFQ